MISFIQTGWELSRSRGLEKDMALKDGMAIFLLCVVLVLNPALSPGAMGGGAPGELLEPPQLIIDGSPKSLDVPPVVERGRVLVPFRALLERLGARVYWDERTRTVTAQKDGTRSSTTGGLPGAVHIRLTVDDTIAVRNGERVVLDVPPRIVNGRTLVPARFVSESLGAAISYDGDKNAVVVTTDGGGRSPSAQIPPMQGSAPAAPGSATPPTVTISPGCQVMDRGLAAAAEAIILGELTIGADGSLGVRPTTLFGPDQLVVLEVKLKPDFNGTGFKLKWKVLKSTRHRDDLPSAGPTLGDAARDPHAQLITGERKGDDSLPPVVVFESITDATVAAGSNTIGIPNPGNPGRYEVHFYLDKKVAVKAWFEVARR